MASLDKNIPVEIRNEIEQCCEKATIYNEGMGFTPPSIIIPVINDRDFRIHITEYVAKKFRDYNVCDSYTSKELFHYIQFSGTESQMYKNLDFVKYYAADYANTYKGVLGIDCMAIADFASNKHYFLENFLDCAPDAVCLFFINEELTNVEAQFLSEIKRHIKNLRQIKKCTTDPDLIFNTILSSFSDHFIDASELIAQAGKSTLNELIDLMKIRTISEANRLVKSAAYFADFSESTPKLTATSILEMIKMYKECEANNYE